MRTVVWTVAILVALVCAAPGAIAGDNRTMVMATLEWPPYASESLPGQGASVAVARAALAAVNRTLEVRFFPWMRAIRVAEKSPEFIGYFPEYHAADIEETFLFSDKMGQSPLGFIQRADQPTEWKTLDDLRGMLIGTVAGYVNTRDFDAMAVSGDLETDPVYNDLTNIRKVARGRIGLAVIDPFVFRWLMARTPDLAQFQGKVVFNDQLLDNKGLYMCFRKTPEGAEAVRLFNLGLARIDWREIQDRYIREALENE